MLVEQRNEWVQGFISKVLLDIALSVREGLAVSEEAQS